jgi:hypothetical protein
MIKVFQKLQSASALALVLALAGCGGGGGDSPEGVNKGSSVLTLSGQVLWDQPVPGAKVEVHCNHNSQVFSTTTDGLGRWVLQVAANRPINGSSQIQECYGEASWDKGLGVTGRLASNVKNYFNKTDLNLNFNAASTSADFNLDISSAVSTMVNGSYSAPLAYTEEFQGQEPVKYLTRLGALKELYPALFPGDFKYADLPTIYAYAPGGDYAQDLMRLARDLDALEIPVKDLAWADQNGYAYFGKSAQFVRNSNGSADVVFTGGRLESGSVARPGDLYPNLGIKVILKSENGSVVREGLVAVPWGSKSFVLGPEFGLASMPSGTKLSLHIPYRVLGQANLLIN